MSASDLSRYWSRFSACSMSATRQCLVGRMRCQAENAMTELQSCLFVQLRPGNHLGILHFGPSPQFRWGIRMVGSLSFPARFHVCVYPVHGSKGTAPESIGQSLGSRQSFVQESALSIDTKTFLFSASALILIRVSVNSGRPPNNNDSRLPHELSPKDSTTRQQASQTSEQKV